LWLLTFRGDGLQLKQLLRVSAIDLVFLFLRQIQTFYALDGLARVQAGRGLKRHVRSEDDVIQSEEVKPALRRGCGAEECRIRIEVLELINRSLLHRFEQRHIIDIRRALP